MPSWHHQYTDSSDFMPTQFLDFLLNMPPEAKNSKRLCDKKTSLLGSRMTSLKLFSHTSLRCHHLPCRRSVWVSEFLMTTCLLLTDPTTTQFHSLKRIINWEQNSASHPDSLSAIWSHSFIWHNTVYTCISLHFILMKFLIPLLLQITHYRIPLLWLETF